MVPVQANPQALADAMDHLVTLTLESDREVAAALTKCREALRAISWERFRIRTEEASRRATVADRRRAVVARHKAVRP